MSLSLFAFTKKNEKQRRHDGTFHSLATRRKRPRGGRYYVLRWLHWGHIIIISDCNPHLPRSVSAGNIIIINAFERDFWGWGILYICRYFISWRWMEVRVRQWLGPREGEVISYIELGNGIYHSYWTTRGDLHSFTITPNRVHCSCRNVSAGPIVEREDPRGHCAVSVASSASSSSSSVQPLSLSPCLDHCEFNRNGTALGNTGNLHRRINLSTWSVPGDWTGGMDQNRTFLGSQQTENGRWPAKTAKDTIWLVSGDDNM